MKTFSAPALPSFRQLCGAIALFSTLTPAVSAQGTLDVLGIYTEPDGTGVSWVDMTPGFSNETTVYVCLSGAGDLTGISGWEFLLSGMDIADGVVVTSWDMTWGQNATYPPLNIATPPEFIVGLGTNHPIPYAENMCVLSFTFFVTDSAEKTFTIHPTNWPSIPGYGAYVGGSYAGDLYPTHWDCGGEVYPAFSVNGFRSALNQEDFAISEAEGGDVNFELYAGAAHAGQDFMMLASMNGTSGINLPGGGILPLTQDFVTQHVYANSNNSMMQNFRGTLDSLGRARVLMDGPANFPLPAGSTLYFAWTTMSPFDYQSNAVEVQIVN